MNKTNVMNKPIITIFLLLACLQAAFAGPVTPDRAQRVAESFFATQPQTRASGPARTRLAWRLTDGRSQSDLLYAFDNESAGGYVLVAGEEAAAPVLGYSLSGSFPTQDMPEAMRDLLDYYANVLRMARERKWVATKTSDNLISSQFVRLETAWWSQGDPYNRYCPVIDGKRCVTGCTATAIGIIMNYHRWPERGSGDLPSYSYNYNGVSNTVPGHSLGHSYDWEAMNRPEGRDDDQIARLLYDIGVMVEMSYTPGASGAGTSYVKRLSQYFGYDKDIRGYYREYTTDAEWEQVIRNEIDAKRPVLFSGFLPDSGHAMVIDGYSGRYFGINFGWGGGYGAREGYSNPNKDGHWFLLTPVEGHEKDLVYFNNWQDIYCNIKPDAGGEPDWFSSTTVSGNLGLPYDFSVGHEFVLSQYIRYDREDVECAYVLFDQAGNVKEQISEPFTSGYFREQTCVISKQPRQGDWIAPAFIVDGKYRIPIHNRFAEFRFRNDSPQKDVKVGFVTENADEFLTASIRNSSEAELKNLKDYLYFRCYKDFTWDLLKADNGSSETVWASNERTTSYHDYYIEDEEGHFRCMSLFQEDVCYHLIHLDPGDYILRVRNPLTGESVTLNLTI